LPDLGQLVAQRWDELGGRRGCAEPSESPCRKDRSAARTIAQQAAYPGDGRRVGVADVGERIDGVFACLGVVVFERSRQRRRRGASGRSESSDSHGRGEHRDPGGCDAEADPALDGSDAAIVPPAAR
jgi:hypothetical protein